MKRQDYVETSEYSEQQMLDMMNLGVTLKACVRAEYFPPLLRKKCIGLMLDGMPPMFESGCETAIYQLGGNVSRFSLPLDPPETLRQTAMLLSRTYDLVIIRCERHESLLALAKYADIPIINAGSDFCTPMHELSSLISMFEHLPREKSWKPARLSSMALLAPSAPPCYTAPARSACSLFRWFPIKRANSSRPNSSRPSGT